MARSQSAWLLLWVWSEPHAAVEDELACILRPRLSERIIGEIVQALYNVHALSPTELAAVARHPDRLPAKVEWLSGQCSYGGNPWLHASYVRKLTITTDPQSGLETISWVYPPLFKRNPVTMKPEQVRGELAGTITRSIAGPLSQRDIGRRALDA